MKLKHKTTGRLFTFVGTFVPQFTEIEYTVLTNEKTGARECYPTAGVLAYFETIEN